MIYFYAYFENLMRFYYRFLMKRFQGEGLKNFNLRNLIIYHNTYSLFLHLHSYLCAAIILLESSQKLLIGRITSAEATCQRFSCESRHFYYLYTWLLQNIRKFYRIYLYFQKAAGFFDCCSDVLIKKKRRKRRRDEKRKPRKNLS